MISSRHLLFIFYITPSLSGLIPQQPPQFMSAVVTEAGEREDEWVVRVKWSEVNSSCNGSVSQYMLCLTLPTSDSLSDSVCIITEHTKHNLTLTANARYVVSVKSVACSNISGPEREQTMIRLNDQTRVNSVVPEFSSATGILEQVTVTYGEFSLEFMEETTSPTYTVALLTHYLVQPKYTGDLEVETGDLSTTISVPPEAIAEYKPTVTVNVPGARPVYLSQIQLLSERDEEELETDVTSVNINGSCKSLVSCLAMDSLQTCTVYCGPSADFASLNNTDSATGSGGDDITLQLPPALGREYHCIVSGTASDGSILFRARAMEIKLATQNIVTVFADTHSGIGCTVTSLLETRRDPHCAEESDGSCHCTLSSNDGRFGIVYGSTSVGSRTQVFTSESNCYDGNEDGMVRVCGRNEEWSKEMVNEDSIDQVSASPLEGFSRGNIILIAVGEIFFVSGVFGAVVLAVLLSRTIKVYCGKVKWWYWLLVAMSAVVSLLSLILWIASGIFIDTNSFVEDGGKVRGENFRCETTASVSVRNDLVVACCVFSLVTLSMWIICTLFFICGVSLSPVTRIPGGIKMSTIRGLLMCFYKEKIKVKEEAMYDIVDLPSSTQPSPLYEEVGVAKKVKRSQDIQLTSNEAYGPIHIQTSPNTAYQQVNI